MGMKHMFKVSFEDFDFFEADTAAEAVEMCMRRYPDAENHHVEFE